MVERIRQWIKENGARLWIVTALFLVGGLCYEAGLLQGKREQGATLVLSIPAPPAEEAQAEIPPSSAQAGDTPAHRETGGTSPAKTACLYVGSKNSTKYHLATCAVAKRIKAENRVCFASQAEARARGYQPSCLK